MRTHTQTQRIVASLMIATLAAVTFAPAAQAGHAYGRKYKRVREARCVERVVVRPASRVVVHEHGAGPVIAGLIGGFLIGTAVSNAHAAAEVHVAEYAPPPPPACPVVADYYYYDPICQARFDRFDDCRDHCSVHEGPRVVQVIETRSGACVETYTWDRGGWRYHAGNWWN